MPEEKELTIEEMKELLIVYKILPSLLDKIDEINKAINKLQESFLDIKKKYNDNTTAIIDYKKEVDDLIDEVKDLPLKVDALIKKVDKQSNKIDELKNSTSTKTQKTATKQIKEESSIEKNKELEDIKKLVNKILNDNRGRKQVPGFTANVIKQNYKISKELAEKVIQHFKKSGMYDEKINTLYINIKK